MSESLEVVWNQRRFDSGLYDCQVVRDGHNGRLTITLVGLINHRLHEEVVKVDRADTDLWRTRCAEVISKPELRMIERPYSPG